MDIRAVLVAVLVLAPFGGALLCVLGGYGSSVCFCGFNCKDDSKELNITLDKSLKDEP